MASSRRSPKRMGKVPPPLQPKNRANAIDLGITETRRSAIGSTTMVESPPAATRKSSLRSGTKTPSPDANRVRFAGAGFTTPDSSAQGPRTPRRASKTATMPRAQRESATRTRTKRASPALVFSPKTARKAKEASKVTKTIEEQTAFIDEEIDSPPPVSSKNFQGTGFRIGTGLPPSPEQLNHTRNDGRTPRRPTTNTYLPTPPTTIVTTRTRRRTPPHTGTTMPVKSPPPPPPPRTITITESATAQRQIYIDGVSDWLSFPMAPTTKILADKPPIEIPTKALLEHMHALKQNFRPLGLEELHIQFYLLQKMLRQFTKKHFNTPWPASRLAAFSLADLSTTHPPFYRIASYLADGSTFQSGWSSFLTSEHTRPHLAHAILGEWLKYNVFGHSCFGLSEAEDAAMTAIDIRYLHYDGFVRTKERAKLLSRILANKPTWEREMDIAGAVDKVVSDLLIVLAPILPDGDSSQSVLRTQLTGLVDVAANLHLCIRLTGMDGTVLRFHSSSKGDQFAYTARQNCVNKSTVSKTVDEMIALRNRESAAAAAAAAADAADQTNGPALQMTREAEAYARVKDKLVIKMPCFPLVLAVVPFGPTLRDFAVEQDMYAQLIRSEDLPALASEGPGPMYIEDIPAEIVRAACFEAMPESCHRDYGRRMEDGETRTKAFGSYVKQYLLNESDVYCEWEFEGEEAIGRGITLRQAVEQAQREKYGYVPAERREKRRKMARNVKVGLATVSVAAAVGYGIARHTAVANAAVSAVKNFKLPSKFSVEDIKGAVKSAMKAADAKTKPFQKAAKWPFRISKDYTKNWAYGHLAAAKSQLANAQSKAGQLIRGAGTISDRANSAMSKASDLTEAAASVLKEVVLPEETIEATPTTGLLSDMLEPIHIGLRESPVKLGIEIGKVADPTRRVSKTTKTAIREQATKIAASAVTRWYEQMGRGAGN